MLWTVITGLIGVFVSVGGYVCCYYYMFQAGEPVSWWILWSPLLFSAFIFCYYFLCVCKAAKRAEERDQEFLNRLKDCDLTIEKLNSSVDNLLQSVSKH